jgi:hypothetical protein
MLFEHEGDHPSQWAAISSIAAKIGCNPETLRGWIRQAERDRGRRPGPTTDEQERIKALECEVRELRLSERNPSQGIGVFRPGGARPPVQKIIAFIDGQRAVHLSADTAADHHGSHSLPWSYFCCSRRRVCAGEKVGHRSGGAVPLRAA